MAFLAMDGHTYLERESGVYKTEREARQACEARGAVLVRERMQGSFYRLPDNRVLRVEIRGWAPGFVVWETVRVGA
jgi:hypothetical protein